MKLVKYKDIEATHMDNEMAKGIDARVAIGKNDGAENFCMRVFEMAKGGCTPKHTHAWEHEIFVHKGKGSVFKDGEYLPIESGTVIFIPGNEEHQLKNTGEETLVFVCLIPKGVPEI